MLVPISWLKDYVDINVSIPTLAKKLVGIGFEVEDIIYQEYLKNKNKNFSDFDKFCIQHCKDIEELLEENEKLKAELQLYQGALKREHEAIHRVNELEEVIDKAKEIIMQPNIEIREYHSCDMDYVYVNEQLLEILKEVE